MLRKLVSRRRAAVAIRIGQEIAKRRLRVFPAAPWPGPTRALTVLTSQAAGAVGAAHPAALVSALRGVGTPLAIPRGVGDSDAGPSDRLVIAAEAAAIVRGEWTIFGMPVSFPDGRPAWLRHPLSGVETRKEHFSTLGFSEKDAGGDIKVLWEINRHAELVRLGQAYRLTGDIAFTDHALTLLDDWIDQNPPHFGLNWTSALDVALRSIAWCWLWRLTADSPSWTPERLMRMLWVLDQSGRFVERFDSIHHSPNTHLTGEALGLAYIGCCFPQLANAARWKEIGMETLLTEIPYQFLTDGFHFERSTGYHLYNLEFYLHAMLLLREQGDARERSIAPHVERGLRAVAAMRAGDGQLPVWGDHDGGATLRLWPRTTASHDAILALGAATLGLPALARGLPTGSDSVCWWLGVEPTPIPEPSGGPKPAPPASRLASFAFPEAGYYGAVELTRRGEPEARFHVTVDAGAHGGQRTGHAHTDLGHIEIVSGSQRIIADPGSVSYADAVARNHYRSQAAHATVRIDGYELAEPRGVFGWRTTSPTPSVATFENDELWACRLAYPVGTLGRHERQVVLVRDYGVLVADWVADITVGDHTIDWRWPLAFSVAPQALAETQDALLVPQIRMQWSASVPFEVALVPGSRSPSYGESTTCSVIDGVARTTGVPFLMCTAFVAPTLDAPLIDVRAGACTVTFPQHLDMPSLSLALRLRKDPEFGERGVGVVSHQGTHGGRR